jgi:hypothetical protein
MNLKKLHEKAEWQKLTEVDFKTRAIDRIMENSSKIEELGAMLTDLQEDIEAIRLELGFVKKQNIKLSQKTRNYGNNNDINTEQKRDSGSVFKPGQSNI